MQILDEQTIQLIRLMVRAVLWIGAGVLVSLLFSICQKYFLKICDQVLAVGADGRRYFTARLDEAKTSVRVLWGWPINDWLPLRRLIRALETLGVDQMDRLKSIGDGLARNTGKFEVKKLQYAAPQPLDPKLFAIDTTKTYKFGTTLVVVGVVVAMITVLNTYLLHLFFASVIPDQLLWRSPFQIYISTVIALMFSAFEIAAGVFMHFFEDADEKESALAMVMKAAPWFILAAVMLVEVIAYSLMSVNMHIADKLQIAPDSDFYPVINYFLAFFGAAISLSLMTGGYVAWTAFQKVGAAANAWFAVASWTRAERASVQLKEAGKAVEESCKKAKDAVESLPNDISDDFRTRLSSNSDVPATLGTLRKRVEAWKQSADDVHSPRYSVHPVLVIPLAFLMTVGALLGIAVCWMIQTLSFVLMQCWRFCSMLGDAMLDRVGSKGPVAPAIANEA